MSALIREIRQTNAEAARVLEKANVRTDTEIHSLTREDLCELLPGAEKFKLRRDIFGIIHKHRPVDVLIKELKDFVPHESFRAALNSDGVLVDYLRILKDLKTQVHNIHGFIDAHVVLLEEFSKSQPEQGSHKGTLSSASTSVSYGPVEPPLPSNNSGQMGNYPPSTGGQQQRSQDSSSSAGTLNANSRMERNPPSTGGQQQRFQRGSFHMGHTRSIQEVTYQVVVSGQTFGAHDQLMNQVKEQNRNGVRFNESSQESQITIIFCPVVSRVGSDVEAAMKDVQDNKPVILVLMHHVHEVKCTPSIRTWSDTKANVVLDVNVSYHETMRGLLKCQQNIDAASEIGNKLLEYSTHRQEVISGNVQAEAKRGSNTVSSSSGLSEKIAGTWWFR